MYYYLNTVLATSSAFFAELMDKAVERHSDLEASGFRTSADQKEMLLLEKKIKICSEASKGMKKNRAAGVYGALDTVHEMINCLSSRDGTLKT